MGLGVSISETGCRCEESKIRDASLCDRSTQDATGGVVSFAEASLARARAVPASSSPCSGRRDRMTLFDTSSAKLPTVSPGKPLLPSQRAQLLELQRVVKVQLKRQRVLVESIQQLPTRLAPRETLSPRSPRSPRESLALEDLFSEVEPEATGGDGECSDTSPSSTRHGRHGLQLSLASGITTVEAATSGADVDAADETHSPTLPVQSSASPSCTTLLSPTPADGASSTQDVFPKQPLNTNARPLSSLLHKLDEKPQTAVSVGVGSQAEFAEFQTGSVRQGAAQFTMETVPEHVVSAVVEHDPTQDFEAKVPEHLLSAFVEREPTEMFEINDLDESSSLAPSKRQTEDVASLGRPDNVARSLIEVALRRIFCSLTEDDMLNLTKCFRMLELPAQAVIVKQGAPISSGPLLCVLTKGIVDVLHCPLGGSVSETVCTYDKCGQCFGELQRLYNSTINKGGGGGPKLQWATFMTRTPATLWVAKRDSVQGLNLMNRSARI